MTMITLDSGQLHGRQLHPRISSAAVEERCAGSVRKFKSIEASMSQAWRIIIVNLAIGRCFLLKKEKLNDPDNPADNLIIGLCSLSKKRSLDDPSNSADKSSDADAEATPMKVLVIDDDATMREAVGYILEDLEIEFDAVGSGEEGLAKLDEQCYGLVFLDLVLHTGSHGIEIFKKLLDRSEHLRIVLMTASGSREPIFEEAAKLQRFILRKPFSLDEVERIIDEAKRKPNPRNTLKGRC